jgi:hypothetical protein
MTAAECSIDGCSRVAMSRSWCGAHYRRWHRYGDPLGLAERKPIAATGVTKECRTCRRELDRGEFPQGWSPCRDCRARAHYASGKTCSTCSAPVSKNAVTGMCRPCWGASRRSQAEPKRLTGRPDGYVVLTGLYDHPNARTRGHILEHVKVMSDMLGRPLATGENVHHKNGVRDDNRPENLELWVVSQPKGQRPADLVAWALEILERYGDSDVAA